jgi:hypothetical protein
LRYPPLSDLTNSYILTLNQLRKCSPISVKYNSLQNIKYYLNLIINNLNNLYVNQNDKKNFKSFLNCFNDHFLKFIIDCFNLIFKNETTLLKIEHLESLNLK